MDDIIFRPFEPGDETAFRELNEAWIRQHFVLEEKDRTTLGDPATYILKPGGHIIMAVRNSSAIGCCALLAMKDGGFEVGKMTVAENCRGLGIGRRLMAWVIDYANKLGARRLYLETNGKLADAVHIYEALGFRHLPPERVTPSPYARASVYMERLLSDSRGQM